MMSQGFEKGSQWSTNSLTYAILNLLKNFMAPFYGWGSTALRLQSHFEKVVYILPLSPQKFLLLIWSVSEGWKAESTLVLPSGFEHGTPGLGIQLLNQEPYLAIQSSN